jgi:tetratricopeptide (TPR) repeat protein
MVMKRMAYAFVLLAVGCEEKAPPPAPPAVAVPPSVPPAPQPQEIAIGSSVPAAIDAFKRGRELMENARAPEAGAELAKAVQLDPKLALAHAYLALVSPDGSKHDDEALALAATLPDVQRVQVEAVVANHRGEYDKERELTTRLASLAPNDWRVQFQLGRMAFDQRKWDVAEAAFSKSTQINPRVGEPFNLLGYALAYQRKYEGAVAALKKYAEMKPGEPNPLDSLAEVEMMAGKLDDAEADFKKAAASPQFYAAWSGAAQARFLRGDFPGGRELLKKARDAAPRPQDKHDVDNAIALSFLAEGKPNDGLKVLSTMEAEAGKLKLPSWAWAPLTRATILGEMGKNADAAKSAVSAIERAEKMALPGGQLGYLKRAALVQELWAQSRLKKTADAEKTLAAYEAEAAKVPNLAWAQSWVHFGRGAIAAAKGDAKAAATEYAKCIDEDFYCAWQLALASDASGDKTGAMAARTMVTTFQQRDPFYVYVRKKIEPPAAAKK